MCFDFIYKLCTENFSFYEEIRAILSYIYTDLHVKCQLFLSDFNTNWIFLKDFRKID